MKSSTCVFFVGRIRPIAVLTVKRVTASDPIITQEALRMTLASGQDGSRPLAGRELRKMERAVTGLARVAEKAGELAGGGTECHLNELSPGLGANCACRASGCWQA